MAKKKTKDADRNNGALTESVSRERDKNGRFVKGNKSGNGRPKIPEDIKQMFRSLAPDCCKVLCEIVNDPSARQADRIKAAEVILDRGFGKPVQAVDLDASSIPQVVFMGEVPD